MLRTPDDLLAFNSEALARVRDRAPLVQCLTSAAVTNHTAEAGAGAA